MKLCLGMSIALLLLGCGGGEGSVDFQDPREPESSGRDGESSGESRDSPGPGESQQPGGGGAPRDLISSCSGTYSCDGAAASLQSSGGSCQLIAGQTPLTLEPDGTITFDALQVGTWTGNSSSFQVCFETDCTTCIEQ
jgi:hypothetical protein